MPLEPIMAAQLADAVYGIRTTNNVRQGVLDRGVQGLDTSWDLAAGQVAGGRSGAGVFTANSGFALVLRGRGAAAGQATVAVRGTVNSYDWLTNINFNLTRGPNGHPVHAGFHQVYTSVIDQVRASLTGFTGSINVVGHSLGGAVATIVAAALIADGRRSLSLYTFGAPRAGVIAFAQALTRDIGAEQMFRVLNLADPVPMVPLFPFAHAPLPGHELRVGGSAGLIRIDAHYMSSYTPLVDGRSWRQLATTSLDANNLRRADYWLDLAAAQTRIPGGALGLSVLGRALQAILDAAGTVIGLAALGAATLIDHIAQLLTFAVQLSSAIGERVLRLIGMVMRWAGRAASAVGGAALTVGEITVAFLTHVLHLMLRPLAALATRALDVVQG